VKVTSKGQITLPVEIRRKLDIQPGDEVEVEILDEASAQLKITKPPSLTSLYGSLDPDKPSPGKEEVRRETARRIGEDLAEGDTQK